MMMMNFLKKIEINRERKYLLIGGAVLLLLGALYRFGPGLVDFFSTADEVALKKNHVEKYLKRVSQRQGVEKARKDLNRTLERLESGLLTGKTPTLAAVEVQNILNEIAGVTGVPVDTMQVLKPEENADAGYLRIPVRFSMRSNIAQLKGMIYGIESASKRLIIVDLSASTTARREGREEILSTITVEGVMAAPKAQG